MWKSLAGTAALLGLLIVAAAAQEQATGLPGGASSLQESHGDWIVGCSMQGSGEKKNKVCVLSQQQTDQKTGQRILAVEFHPADSAVGGILVLPFGLALAKGVTLQLDDQPAMPELSFRTCLPVGCLVDVTLDDKAAEALAKASTLKINATISESGQKATMAIPLNGFKAAAERATALMK